MPKVPDINKPEPPKRKSVLYVCTTDNQPLTPEDQKALEEFMQYRIDRAKKAKKGNDMRLDDPDIDTKARMGRNRTPEER